MKKGTIRLILDIWSFLRIKRKKQILFAFFLMILSALSEVISISSVLPFAALISDSENFKKYKIINQFISKFSLTDNQILILLCFIFIILIFISSFIRIINIKYALNISAKIGNDFGTEAYYKSLNQSYEDYLLGNSSKLISTNLVEISRVEGVIYHTLSLGIALIISFGIIFSELLFFKITF